MDDSRFIDPRLVAREALFQNLHLSIFETMGYVGAIQALVAKTGHDIEQDNPDFVQLLRDYEVTKNLSKTDQEPLKGLCKKTDAIINNKTNAFANCAQLCSAATNALNHWRILSEVPADLRDNDTVTKDLKTKLEQTMHAWKSIVADLSGVKIHPQSAN